MPEPPTYSGRRLGGLAVRGPTKRNFDRRGGRAALPLTSAGCLRIATFVAIVAIGWLATVAWWAAVAPGFAIFVSSDDERGVGVGGDGELRRPPPPPWRRDPAFAAFGGLRAEGQRGGGGGGGVGDADADEDGANSREGQPPSSRTTTSESAASSKTRADGDVAALAASQEGPDADSTPSRQKSVSSPVGDLGDDGSAAERMANTTEAAEEVPHRPPLLKHGRCARRWEEGMLDSWRGKHIRDREGYKITRLTFDRENTHSRNMGKVGMSYRRVRSPYKTFVVRARGPYWDATSHNAWHRLAVQYMAWISYRVAARRIGVEGQEGTRPIYLINCTMGDGGLTQGWTDLGDARCSDEPGVLNATMEEADVVIDAPREGLLWDLAWVSGFKCGPSGMFRDFVEHFRRKRLEAVKPLPQRQPLGCFVDRRGRDIRDVENRDDFLGQMNQTFASVRIVAATKDHSTSDLINLMDGCAVIIGVHGAGLVNMLYAPENASVIEIVPKDERPRYYRNLSVLDGRRYKAVMDDFFLRTNVTVDMVHLREALDWSLKIRKDV